MNNKKEEYIEINLMAIFISLYKNIKYFIFFLILGSIIIAFLFTSYSKDRGAVVKQMITIPSYFDGNANRQQIINFSDMNLILQTILKEEKQNSDNKLITKITLLYPWDKYEVDTQRQVNTPKGQNSIESKKLVLDKNYLLKQKYDDQKKYFTLITKSKKDNVNSISQEYSKIMKKFSESDLVKTKISLWKKSIEINIKNEAAQLIEYKVILKQDEIYLKELIAKKPSILGTVSQTQSMILKYISTVDNLKKQIFSLKQSIEKNNLKLKTANLTFSKFSDVLSTPVIHKLSKKVLLMSIFLVIFGSLALTFLVAFFRKLANEAKKNS